jgi:hypothetical protein
VITPTNSSHNFETGDFEGEGKSYSAGYGMTGSSYGGSWLSGSERENKLYDQFNPYRFGINPTINDVNAYTVKSLGGSKGPSGPKIGGAYSHTRTWLLKD